MLISRAWRFQFRVPGPDAMSYITPLWLTEQEIPDCISKQIAEYPEDTHLYLPLKLQASPSEAESFLKQVNMAVDPCILLNMRHLNQLEIIDKRERQSDTHHKKNRRPDKTKRTIKGGIRRFPPLIISPDLSSNCVSPPFRTLFECTLVI